ncbi:Dehydrogenase/reductase SDR family member on chromosome X [Leucoagaricus sp. SymC.cos]|nr:Dehydrogenase/reductase SDR family member on chromosome X [Leucoagaricus sp. SymC.cos]
MPLYSLAQASNATFQPSYTPVAIFVGGTTGIGQSMVQLLARTLNGRVRLIVVGRNEAAAREIITNLPPATGEGAGCEFLSCNVTVMRNVHETARHLSRINFLVLSAGVFSVKGWEETEDGLDRKLASRYYSRWALANDLLPLLRNAKQAGEDTKVMSILGAAMLQSSTYNDLMMAEFAERNPEVSFIHVFPGYVRTAALTIDHWLATLLTPLLKLISYFFAVTPDVCAEHMLYALLDSTNGLSRRNEKGDDIGDKKFLHDESAQKKLWDHTVVST